MWDREADFVNVAQEMDYEVSDEQVDHNLMMTLRVRWTLNRANNGVASLSHRLKETYRHQKGDLHVQDGRDLLVTFYKLPSSDNPDRWELKVRRKPRPSPEIYPQNRAGNPSWRPINGEPPPVSE
jgi:hypothetical protein